MKIENVRSMVFCHGRDQCQKITKDVRFQIQDVRFVIFNQQPSVSRAKHSHFFPPSIILSSSTEREPGSKDTARFQIEDRRTILLLLCVKEVIIVYHVLQLSKEPAVEKSDCGEHS
jgi:hypothetical protein